MVLSALRGALGLCSRLPVDQDGDDWAAVRSTPLAFPLVGYAIGLLVAIPFVAALLVGLTPPVAAAAYLAAVYLVTGAHHADGLADLGDAATVHGSPMARREVMHDTTLGVGGVLALTVMLAVLLLGALALAGAVASTMGAGLGLHEVRLAAGVIVAAEVSAKLGMAAVASLGRASHAGTGSQFTSRAGPAQLLGPVLVALPAVLLTGPTPVAAATLFGGPIAALAVLRWSDRTLDGVGGDAFGATNEIGRALAIHLGVIAWSAA